MPSFTRFAVLCVCLLWSSTLHASAVVTGLGPGGLPQVSIFDALTTVPLNAFLAYDPVFSGGVRVATGDVNGDGVADIITGAGPGGGGHVRVLDGRTGASVHSFFAFDPNFSGGVFVAAGDVNNDGIADIVVSADEGGGPHVKVFDGRTLEVRTSFFPYDPGFAGGVRVAAGDVNGDGVPDIVTGPGAGAAAHVKVFDGSSGQLIRSFVAFDQGFTGGVFVAAGDINGDDRADIVVGAGAGGGPHVRVFDAVGGDGVLASFNAFDAAFTGGVRVAAGDVNGDGIADIITGAGAGGGPHVKVFNGATFAVVRAFLAAEPTFSGGVFVAADVTRNEDPDPAKTFDTLVAKVQDLFPRARHLLQNAAALLKARDARSACRMVAAFAQQVISQTGKTLTAAEAEELLHLAHVLRRRLGCL
jgi:hypothetical protein